MARFYLDEDVPIAVANHLRALGHDVETTEAAGRKGSDDPSQLAYAIAQDRIVITHNRIHFRRLHRQDSTHRGIVEFTRDDTDPVGLATRVDGAVRAQPSMAGQIIRVYRPSKP